MSQAPFRRGEQDQAQKVRHCVPCGAKHHCTRFMYRASAVVICRQKRCTSAEIAVQSPEERPSTSTKVATDAWQCQERSSPFMTCTRDSLLCMNCRHHAPSGSRRFTDSKLSRSLLQRCYGCGAILQTVDEGSPGYVPLDKYSIKQRHRQLGTLICRSPFCRPCLNRPSRTSASVLQPHIHTIRLPLSAPTKNAILAPSKAEW